MRSSATAIDASILPRQARRELLDFYTFLVSKYVPHQERDSSGTTAASTGTAAALAASPLVGIWKDRELGDSRTFARSLREQAQSRRLS